VTGRQRLVLVLSGFTVLAYLVSLGPVSWAVVDDSGAAVFELLGTSSAVTLVVVGLTGAGLFSPPPRGGWYAVVARVAWLFDLACVAGIGWRIARGGDGIGFGPGWYLAVVVVLVAGAGALAVPVRGR
jgi:hypothetical protein